MTTAPPERTERQIAEEEAGGRMSFFAHLVELRQRLISSLIGIAVGAAIGITISKRFINFISAANAEGAACQPSGPASLLFASRGLRQPVD